MSAAIQEASEVREKFERITRRSPFLIDQAGTNPYLPFGGVNASGMGRLSGWNTFAEASNPRSIMEEGPPLDKDPCASFPPYSQRYKKMAESMLLKRPPVVSDAIIRAINGVIRIGSLFSRH